MNRTAETWMKNPSNFVHFISNLWLLFKHSIRFFNFGNFVEEQFTNVAITYWMRQFLYDNLSSASVVHKWN